MKPLEQFVEQVDIHLRVNESDVNERVPARMLLADLLRERLGLTGTHLGCEHGVCGACTVLIDGAPVRSCITLAVQADGSTVTTIEDSANRRLETLRSAFSDHHALQCGFCTPGILLTAAVADPTDFPGDDGIREMLAGTLCRCTGYENIVAAVRSSWGRVADADSPFQAIAEALRTATAADRTTIRLERPPAFFPVVAESRAEGVEAVLGDNRVDLASAPTFLAVRDGHAVVVQNDCLTDPPATPPEVMSMYGVRAQMLAPVVVSDRLVGTISVHQLRVPRGWSESDRAALEQATSATVAAITRIQ